MASVTIEFESEADFNIIRINDQEVMRSTGQRIVSLPEGSHVLTWQIKGQRGDKYTLAITEPGEAEFKRTAVLDRFGLDFGFHSFEL